MRIGIIGAMDNEVSLLRENINEEHVNILGFDFYIGNINNNEVILAKSGVGKVNAAILTTLMVREFEVDFILNTGIAGGYKIPCETIVLTDVISYNDVDASGFGYKLGQMPGMPYEFFPSPEYRLMIKKVLSDLKLNFVEAKIYSGDKFVTSTDSILGFDSTKPSAFEMEGAAIAHTCIKLGVDFVILRFISDDVTSPNQESDYMTFEQKMSNLSADVCLKVLKELS